MRGLYDATYILLLQLGYYITFFAQYKIDVLVIAIY